MGRCGARECIKIFHDVERPDGTSTHIDFSPYNTPTELDFAAWVELGQPTRKDFSHGCNFDREDLLVLAKKKIAFLQLFESPVVVLK
jgi:hypothetical protein